MEGDTGVATVAFGGRRGASGATAGRGAGGGGRPGLWSLIQRAAPVAVLALMLWVQPSPGQAEEDQIDRLLRSGRLPADMIREHGHSDFTEPVGRFLDLLAAGAVAKARALQPAACAAWRSGRRESPLTGKVGVWNTEIDLDTLCAPP